jgi:hypothetical protein
LKEYENTNRGIGRHKISCRLKNVTHAVKNSDDSDESDDESIPSVSPPAKRPRTIRGVIAAVTSSDDGSEFTADVAVEMSANSSAVGNTDSERDIFVQRRTKKRFSFVRQIIDDTDNSNNSE